MRNQEKLDEPRLNTEELERELGDSEEWDEATRKDEDSDDACSHEP